LLRGILDSHPQIVAYPEETNFFRRYLPAARGKPLDEALRLSNRYITRIFEWNQVNPPKHQAGFPDRDYSYISVDAVRQRQGELLRERFRHDGDVLSAAILAFGQVSGALTERTRRWVEKTPYNERFAAQIFDWWPEARCVHMIRDPRDNYVSYQRKHADWTASTFALSWRRSTRAGLANREKYGAERYLIIRYEDFTRDAEGIIAGLCAFLGIDDDLALRSPTRGGKSWRGNSMFAERFQGISQAPVGRWRESLTPRACFMLETLAGREMASMRYEQSQPNSGELPLPVRLSAYKTLLIVNLKEKLK